jgi:hypothetical protein
MRIILLFFILFLQGQFLPGPQNLFISPGKYNLSSYKTIEETFSPPQGFTRVQVKQNSFAAYLRSLPVLKDSFNVMDFKDRVWKKKTDSSVSAVVPVNISGKRLWQCMDILLGLHANYLRQTKHTDVTYPLPDGTQLSWLEWQKGIRPVFKGMGFSKILKSKEDSSQKNFTRYLNAIFEYSGTQSFWHYYPDVDLKDIQPADFIVKKGKKGHAVLIVDMAENTNGEKLALIGQGDTPACQFYLLKQKDGNPWFKINMNASYPSLPIKKQMNWIGLRRFPE